MSPSTITCFGEVLLRLSPPGRQRLLQSPSLDAHVGGAEANVAVALAHLGERARLVSVLPDAPLGHACAAELRRQGVALDGVQLLPGRMGLYFFVNGAGARPGEVVYDRAGSAFASAAASIHEWPSLLSGSRWLHVSGITAALGDAPRSALAAAVRAARSAGVLVSFDCNFRPQLWRGREAAAAQALRELAASSDLLLAAPRDLALAFDSAPDASTPAVAFARCPHVRWVAWTERGESHGQPHLEGLLAPRDGPAQRSRRYPLRDTVDRMGAGDAFAAGLIHALSQELAPAEAVQLAAASACLKHFVPGDFSSSTAADVRRLAAGEMPDILR